MEGFLGFLVAGLLACAVTWLELDKTFYVPGNTAEKAKLYSWWWGFIVLNGILAGGLYLAADTVDIFKQPINPWPLRAIVMGLSYLALIRLKIGTFQTRQGEISAGFEALYDGLKEAFLRRINKIILKARIDESTEMTKAKTLAELADAARDYIKNNDLLSAERKKSLRAFVARVESDASSTDRDRRMTLAIFILSERVEESESP